MPQYCILVFGPRTYKKINIVTSRVVHATNKTGSSSDDWIY
jgi:hypothetical protein